MVSEAPLLDIWIRLTCNRLHLPAEIVPATHKKAARAPRPANVRGPGGGGDGAYRAPRGDRDDYRKKEGGAPGEFMPQFAGVGRGAPRE
jgi:small subunit ribosomal protein S10e